MGYVALAVRQPKEPVAPALGIDLGTTYSLAAIWKDGRPVVLHPEGESGLIPPAVHFPAEGHPITGREAPRGARAVAPGRRAVRRARAPRARGRRSAEHDLQHQAADGPRSLGRAGRPR